MPMSSRNALNSSVVALMLFVTPFSFLVTPSMTQAICRSSRTSPSVIVGHLRVVTGPGLSRVAYALLVGLVQLLRECLLDLEESVDEIGEPADDLLLMELAVQLAAVGAVAH